MRIIQGSIDARVEATHPEWVSLRQLLTVDDPDKYKSRDYHQGLWDGEHRYFNDDARTFPAGLIPFVEEKLDDLDADYSIVRSSPSRKIDIPTDLLRGITLRDYQIAAISRMLEMGRGVVRSPPRSGKSAFAAAVIKLLDVPSLLLVDRLRLLDQHMRTFKAWGLTDICAVGDGEHEVTGKHVIATVQTLHHAIVNKAPWVWELLGSRELMIADECFTGDTLIDGTPISAIRRGDVVRTWDESTGLITLSRVVRTMRRRPSSLVRVRWAHGHVCCTQNHPFLTQRGWVQAGRLKRGDQLAQQKCREYGGAMLDVSYGVSPVCTSDEEPAAGADGGLFERVLGQTVLRYYGANQSTLRIRENASEESDVASGNPREDASNPHGSWRLAPSRTGGKRPPTSSPSGSTGSAPWVGNRGGSAHEYAKVLWLSRMLQAGHWQPFSENRSRGGRAIAQSQGPSSAGPQEGQAPSFVRVESVEIIEPGSSGTFGGVCDDGYVYNLEVAGTHTYFANDVVVHNCHHLSSHLWLAAFNACDAPWRFGLSGTPFHDRGTKLKPVDLWLVGATGPLIYDISSSYLREKGFLANPQIYMAKISQPKFWNDNFPTVYRYGIVTNKFRNQLITQIAGTLSKEGRRVLILVTRIEHGELLLRQIHDEGVRTAFTWSASNLSTIGVLGKLTRTQCKHEKVIRDLESRRIQVLIGSTILDEGVDIPVLDAVIVAGGMKSVIKTTQRSARGMTAFEGKADTLIFDFEDAQHPYLFRHSKERIQTYLEDEIDVSYQVPAQYLLEPAAPSV